MNRQEHRQVLRTIKFRSRINLFTYSPFAFEKLVDEGVYEEDVKRAFSTATLLEGRDGGRSGTHYTLRGFAMNEAGLVLVCVLKRRLVEIVDLYWD